MVSGLLLQMVSVNEKKKEKKRTKIIVDIKVNNLIANMFVSG